MKKALTIAGTDSSGGAGVQADLKTFCAHKVYGMSVICAVTAQNTTGVTDVHNIPAETVGKQLDAVFTDIYPDAVKIGMVSVPENIRMIADKLREYDAKNIVLDPVMISTSGCRLMEPEAEQVLSKLLFPLASIITPNISEAEHLTGLAIRDKEDMLRAANMLSSMTGGAVLVKGGHLNDCADDLLLAEGKEIWYPGKRIHTQNTHGTGCTLSSAICCGLAEEFSVCVAVKKAKDYVAGALADGLDLGRGCGPLNHLYRI